MQRRSTPTAWLKYGALPLLVLVVAMLLRFLCFVVLRIDSDAMAPAVERGAYLVASRYASPEVNDVVLFRSAPDAATLSIARVVGVPGDSLVYSEGRLLRNGALVRSYQRAESGDYALRLPRAEESLPLSPFSLVAYRKAIEHEVERFADAPSVRWEWGRLYIAGVEVGTFEFHKDYYWLLVDDGKRAPDSRHIGIVSREAIEAVVLLHY